MKTNEAKKYRAEIDGGEGGSIAFTAASESEAWTRAKRWADQGDYTNHKRHGVGAYDLTLSAIATCGEGTEIRTEEMLLP